jgi:hypothetical protein
VQASPNLKQSTREAVHFGPWFRLGTVAALAAFGLGAASLAHCDQQPKPYCITADLQFATKLIQQSQVESQPGACMGLGPASFDVDPRVSFTTYWAQDSNGQPDYSKGSVAVKTTEIGNLLIAAQGAGVQNQAMDGAKEYSEGAFTAAQADNSGFCTVPALSNTHLVLPAYGTNPVTPAVDIELTWSDLQAYVTADIIGTQVQATLVDKRVTPAGTCTITYKVVALAPAVPCNVTNAEGGIEMNPDGSFVTDPGVCSPQPDPDAGMYLGSGISPVADYVCNSTLGWCTINGDSVPAIK